MGYEKRTPTPIRGKSGPSKPTSGPVRRPGDRFGPAGTSDEIGDGSDHIFGPGNGAMMEVMVASANNATRGGDLSGRGGGSKDGHKGDPPDETKDGYGPAGTSDEVGKVNPGGDLSGFLGHIETKIT